MMNAIAIPDLGTQVLAFLPSWDRSAMRATCMTAYSLPPLGLAVSTDSQAALAACSSRLQSGVLLPQFWGSNAKTVLLLSEKDDIELAVSMCEALGGLLTPRFRVIRVTGYILCFKIANWLAEHDPWRLGHFELHEPNSLTYFWVSEFTPAACERMAWCDHRLREGWLDSQRETPAFPVLRNVVLESERTAIVARPENIRAFPAVEHLNAFSPFPCEAGLVLIERLAPIAGQLKTLAASRAGCDLAGSGWGNRRRQTSFTCPPSDALPHFEEGWPVRVFLTGFFDLDDYAVVADAIRRLGLGDCPHLPDITALAEIEDADGFYTGVAGFLSRACHTRELVADAWLLAQPEVIVSLPPGLERLDVRRHYPERDYPPGLIDCLRWAALARPSLRVIVIQHEDLLCRVVRALNLIPLERRPTVELSTECLVLMEKWPAFEGRSVLIHRVVIGQNFYSAPLPEKPPAWAACVWQLRLTLPAGPGLWRNAHRLAAYFPSVTSVWIYGQVQDPRDELAANLLCTHYQHRLGFSVVRTEEAFDEKRANYRPSR